MLCFDVYKMPFNYLILLCIVAILRFDDNVCILFLNHYNGPRSVN